MLTNELAGYMAGGLYNAFSADVLKAADLFKPPPGIPRLGGVGAFPAPRRWKFQPAQFNGHAVPANMVLQFNFAPTR